VNATEHPFAPYVRILGKGKTGSRSLDFDEARSAFTMILRGDVEPVQLGAFLMLLRVKEETPEELAGFIEACRDAMPPADDYGTVTLDWSSYAGKRAQSPWYLLSALLLAENGVSVLMHGADGHTPGRLYSEPALSELGVSSARDTAEVHSQLRTRGFAYLPLARLCPALHYIIQLRPLLGLRSPVNTLARLLNPAAAPYSIQSVFHPAYAALHSGADQLLRQPHAMVFKGEGGEVEIKPNARTRCHLLRGGTLQELTWPPTQQERPQAAPTPNSAALRRLWREEERDEYGTAAVIDTAACALVLLERADGVADARELAQQWWLARERSRF
jgi:anthranilate phosphoribosyltransferase